MMERAVFARGIGLLQMVFESFRLDGQTTELWYRLLGDLPAVAFEKAVLKIVMTREKPPTIAAIRKAATEESDESLSAEEAWTKVIDDVHKRGIYDEPIYEDPKLEKTKRAISWRELCDMTPDSRRIVRAQFMKIYDSICEREKLKAITGEKDEVNHALLQRLFGGMLPGKR
jgi:hypothetical protein